jgi:SAM-dependent methyltransferase
VPRDWDQYYSDPANLNLNPDPLLAQFAATIPPGDALDLACGPGRHALHLAQRGWRVTAVDASAAAIRELKRRAQGLPIRAVHSDLERGGFVIEPWAYDLICDFFYLQRDLFPAIRRGLRPGGHFLGAIRLTGGFSLQPGELRAQFAHSKIHYYDEGEAARIVAQIPDHENGHNHDR